MSRRLVWLMAVACAAGGANLYYGQPLLDSIANEFGVGAATAGLMITAGQLGYAAGIFLLVPLGDRHDRRRLVGRLMLIAGVSLGVAAIAPSFAVLAVTLAITGLSSVSVQILVPFSSDLADEADRGRVVGIVVSGILIGILLARTISGVIAGLTDWRVVYGYAAVVMFVLSAILSRALPTVPPKTTMPYRALLGSVVAIVREEPMLRRRMYYGWFAMASFSILWTTIAFLLSGAPYHYGEATIGLFGLVGVAGAAAAQGAGRLADAGHTTAATGGFILAMLVGWGLLALGRSSVGPLVAGIALVDLGVQGTMVTNQSIIFRLRSEVSRMTAANMGSIFVAGAIASALGGVAWQVGGWYAVCGLAGGVAAAGLAMWAVVR